MHERIRPSITDTDRTGRWPFAPGTEYYYSNTNYVVLGLIIEQLDGRSLASAFARLFEPLGTTNTMLPRGMTNPKIAERLLIGRSTVKTHLDHVFAKLGMNTRAQVAAQVARETTTDTCDH